MAVKWWIWLAVAPLLAGCGGGDARTADTDGIQVQLVIWAAKQGAGKVTADCPDTVPWKVGGVFHCILTDPAGETTRIAVTMEDEQGAVTWVVG